MIKAIDTQRTREVDAATDRPRFEDSAALAIISYELRGACDGSMEVSDGSILSSDSDIS